MFISLLTFLLFQQIQSAGCSQFSYHCTKCDSNSCLECEDGYGVDKDQNSETYGRCIKCKNEFCEICSFDAGYCNKCDNFLYPFYTDTKQNSASYGQCVICPRNCKTCADFNTCTSCVLEYGLNSDHKCVPCSDPNCYSCFENFEICTECSSMKNHDSNPESPTYGKCVDLTLENFWKPIPGDLSTCKECNNGYYLKDGKCFLCEVEHCSICNELPSKCTDCLSGFILDRESNSCLSCSSNGNCLYCKTNTQLCDKCQKGYALYSETNECINTGNTYCEKYEVQSKDNIKCVECENHYGLDEKGICQKCTDQKCMRCSSNYKKCEECLYIDNTVYYVDKEGKCVVGCDDPKCYNCEKSNNFQYNTCHDNYGFNEQKRCTSCQDTNCKECNSNFRECTVCKPGFGFNEKGQCVGCADKYCIDCEDDYTICETCKFTYGFNEDKKCTACEDKNCLMCNRNYKECIICNASYYGYNNGCAECTDRSCSTCKNTPDYCETCKNGFNFDFTEGTLNYDKCVACPENCLDCRFGQPDYCLNCDDYYELTDDNKCTGSGIKPSGSGDSSNPGSGDGSNPGSGNDSNPGSGDNDGSNNSGKNKLPIGAIAGIAVGAVVLVGLIIFLIVFFLIIKPKRAKKSNSSQEDVEQN